MVLHLYIQYFKAAFEGMKLDLPMDQRGLFAPDELEQNPF